MSEHGSIAAFHPHGVSGVSSGSMSGFLDPGSWILNLGCSRGAILPCSAFVSVQSGSGTIRANSKQVGTGISGGEGEGGKGLEGRGGVGGEGREGEMWEEKVWEEKVREGRARGVWGTVDATTEFLNQSNSINPHRGKVDGDEDKDRTATRTATSTATRTATSTATTTAREVYTHDQVKTIPIHDRHGDALTHSQHRRDPPCQRRPHHHPHTQTHLYLSADTLTPPSHLSLSTRLSPPPPSLGHTSSAHRRNSRHTARRAAHKDPSTDQQINIQTDPRIRFSSIRPTIRTPPPQPPPPPPPMSGSFSIDRGQTRKHSYGGLDMSYTHRDLFPSIQGVIESRLESARSEVDFSGQDLKMSSTLKSSTNRRTTLKLPIMAPPPSPVPIAFDPEQTQTRLQTRRTVNETMDERTVTGTNAPRGGIHGDGEGEGEGDADGDGDWDFVSVHSMPQPNITSAHLPPPRPSRRKHSAPGKSYDWVDPETSSLSNELDLRAVEVLEHLSGHLLRDGWGSEFSSHSTTSGSSASTHSGNQSHHSGHFNPRGGGGVGSLQPPSSAPGHNPLPYDLRSLASYDTGSVRSWREARKKSKPPLSRRLSEQPPLNPTRAISGGTSYRPPPPPPPPPPTSSVKSSARSTIRQLTGPMTRNPTNPTQDTTATLTTPNVMVTRPSTDGVERSGSKHTCHSSHIIQPSRLDQAAQATEPNRTHPQTSGTPQTPVTPFTLMTPSTPDVRSSPTILSGPSIPSTPTMPHTPISSSTPKYSYPSPAAEIARRVSFSAKKSFGGGNGGNDKNDKSGGKGSKDGAKVPLLLGSHRMDKDTVRKEKTPSS